MLGRNRLCLDAAQEALSELKRPKPNKNIVKRAEILLENYNRDSQRLNTMREKHRRSSHIAGVTLPSDAQTFKIKGHEQLLQEIQEKKKQRGIS